MTHFPKRMAFTIHRQLDDPALFDVIHNTAWDVGYTVL